MQIHRLLNRILKRSITSYLLIVVHLLAGLIILLSAQQLEIPEWFNRSTLIFVLFLLINLSYVLLFKLQKALKEYWAIRKLPYFVFGVLAGAVMAVIPDVLSVLTGQSGFENLEFKTDYTLPTFAVTLAIVGWEELWFRGLILNHCHKHISAIHLSLTMGMLFMLIHLLNPEVEMIKTGPTLFFAGATMTILYFYFRNIWLPVGIHLGNNYFGSIIEAKVDDSVIFGNDGYIQAGILAILYLFFTIRIRRHSGRKS